jgi:asparagine synthetase B (glutamine-hydrolysing)
MKQIRTSFNIVSVIALLALTAGCSTTSSTQNKESMLVASGFKVITPRTAAQQQKLQQLPPGHVAMVNRNGRTYYIFPDAAHNQAYVGGPKEYQAYQQLRVANNIANENIETA